MEFEAHYLRYKQLVDERLATVATNGGPRHLYEPTRYLLTGSGKRVRAVLVMLAAEAVGGDGVAALDAGCAVEILHNFTLVHDDIMDRATTRRGRPTVHVKWDEGTAILVGDVMVGIAQRMLVGSGPKRLAESVDAFARGLIDVCEGQMLDKEFETRTDVTIEDYLEMIAMKTGRLVEMAAEVGGLFGDGTPEQIAGLRAYARGVGQAFQIQDDLLDIVADEAELGKRIGGDVIEGKRTYLLIRAVERVRNGADGRLLARFHESGGLPAEEVSAMLDLFTRHGILDSARDDVRLYTDRAEQSLLSLPDTPAREMLRWFARMVMNRTR